MNISKGLLVLTFPGKNGWFIIAVYPYFLNLLVGAGTVADIVLE